MKYSILRIVFALVAAAASTVFVQNANAVWDEVIHYKTGFTKNPSGVGGTCTGDGTVCDIIVVVHHSDLPACLAGPSVTTDGSTETQLSTDFYHAVPTTVSNTAGIYMVGQDMYYSKTGRDISADVAPYLTGVADCSGN